MQGMFYGIGAAVIGIITRSAFKLTKLTLGKDKTARRRPTPTTRSRGEGAARAGRARRLRLVGVRAGGTGLDPHALAFTDRLVSDAAAAHIKVVSTVDSTPCWASSAPASVLRRCAPAQAERGQRLAAAMTRPTTPRSLRATWPSATARSSRRSRSGTSPTRPTNAISPGPDKAQRYAALLRAAYPAIKAAEPGRAGARRARSSAPTACSCARSTRPASRASTTGSRSTSTPSRSRRCARSTKSSSRTATHAAVARRVRLDQLLARAQRIEQEQACVTDAGPGAEPARLVPLARARPLRRGRGRSTSCRTPRSENFGVLTRRRRAQAGLRGARAACSPRRSARSARSTLQPARGAAARRRERLRPGRRLHAAGSLRTARLRYRAMFTLDRFNRYSLALPRGARHARPAACASTSTGPAVARGARAASDRRGAGMRARRGCYSALRNSATNVSARIFRSSPSDQWAM